MREILFRAKRLDNGEWVQGANILILSMSGVYIANTGDKILTVSDTDGRNIVTTKGKMYEVAPETAGQFTGLTDKNGTKIFEGDIVNYPDTYLSWSGDVEVKGNVGAVEWGERTMCFYFSNRNAVDMEEFFVLNGCMTEVEVIGNIHDNPELIGGADNGL